MTDYFLYAGVIILTAGMIFLTFIPSMGIKDEDKKIKEEKIS